jgi:hypothetical protein
LKLKHDEPVPSFAFNFDLRRYVLGARLNIAETCFSGPPGTGKEPSSTALVWAREGEARGTVHTMTRGRARQTSSAAPLYNLYLD